MTVVDVGTLLAAQGRGELAGLGDIQSPGEEVSMGKDASEPPHQQPLWLTIPEVAERLRYSTRTIQRYVSLGLFGPVLRGSSHSLRISIEAVESFEREHLGK